MSPSRAETRIPVRWLNQAQAADYLGVTDRTIRNYIARGQLKGHRVRGSRLIRLDVADLDALMGLIPTVGTMGGDAA